MDGLTPIWHRLRPQTVKKCQQLPDFLASHPVLDDSPLVTEILNEEIMAINPEGWWEMYFDSASNNSRGK